MKLLQRGRVTVPKAIREALGIIHGDTVEVTIKKVE